MQAHDDSKKNCQLGAYGNTMVWHCKHAIPEKEPQENSKAITKSVCENNITSPYNTQFSKFKCSTRKIDFEYLHLTKQNE